MGRDTDRVVLGSFWKHAAVVLLNFSPPLLYSQSAISFNCKHLSRICDYDRTLFVVNPVRVVH